MATSGPVAATPADGQSSATGGPVGPRLDAGDGWPVAMDCDGVGDKPAADVHAAIAAATTIIATAVG